MTSTTDDSPSKIAVNSLAHTTEVQRESGFQVILDPVVPAPFSTVLLALAIPMFSGKEMATASILPPTNVWGNRWRELPDTHQEEKKVFTQAPSKSQARCGHPWLRTAGGNSVSPEACVVDGREYILG